ncbi:MAG: PilZ domain-containing protein [Acidobacteriota bacterium]|nr:MAG: PilZ domain-containing protein [Acidobacteriota bacterium]
MSINQRRHNRLAVDLPVFRFAKDGEKLETLIYQISVGGCLIAWDDTISQGEVFRMEIQLPNRNWLPLRCKAVYCFTDDAIGVQFEEITQFEQDLLVEIMSNKLTREGIPFNFDPYSPPSTYRDEDAIQDHDSKAGRDELAVHS